MTPNLTDEAIRGSGARVDAWVSRWGLQGMVEPAIIWLENCRWRRLSLWSGLPIFAAIATVMIGLAPMGALFSPGGLLDPFRGETHELSGASGCVGALALLAAALAYLRAVQLWRQEWEASRGYGWLLSSLKPGPTVTATVIAGALSSLRSAVPAAIVLLVLCLSLGAWSHITQALILTPAFALLGAAFGAATFQGSLGRVSRIHTRTVTAIAAVILAALSWHVWRVDRGSVDLLSIGLAVGRAAALLSPMAFSAALGIPDWWPAWSRRGLLDGFSAGGFSLAYMGILALSIWAMHSIARSAYVSAFHTAETDEAPQRADEPEIGQEFYWRGFRNPVLTLDARTRLRRKETLEFVFLAAVVIAAGGFVPLTAAAAQLDNPLQIARVARDAFTWLTITTFGLLAVVGPGLTAEAIADERRTGTLELLMASTLRPGNILSGKLMGAAAVLILLISPSLPLFALCYLFRGTSLVLVAVTYLIILYTIFFICTVGVSQSAIAQRSGHAKFWAYATTFAFMALPGGPGWFVMSGAGTASIGWCNLAGLLFWTGLLAIMYGNAREALEHLRG